MRGAVEIRSRDKEWQAGGLESHGRSDVSLGWEYYNEKAERERTWFNAFASRQEHGEKPSAADVREITELAKHKMPAAEYVLGIWELNGTNIPKDAADGLARVQRAAAKHYGSAMYFVGNAQYRGTVLPKDAAAGLELLRNAAVLGSVEAQHMLGQMYENGSGVDVDPARAKRYYRLCGSRGVAGCEYRLAKLLLAESSSEDKRLEGVAWLQLAQQHHWGPAQQEAADLTAQLTPEQAAWVDKLRPQLEHVPR